VSGDLIVVAIVVAIIVDEDQDNDREDDQIRQRSRTTGIVTNSAPIRATPHFVAFLVPRFVVYASLSSSLTSVTNQAMAERQ
jgi:hypothetical protein